MSRPSFAEGATKTARYCAAGRGEISDGLANTLTVHSHLPESRKVRVDPERDLGNWTPFKDTQVRKIKLG
jgi:hypothetical protein